MKKRIAAVTAGIALSTGLLVAPAAQAAPAAPSNSPPVINDVPVMKSALKLMRTSTLKFRQATRSCERAQSMTDESPRYQRTMDKAIRQIEGGLIYKEYAIQAINATGNVDTRAEERLLRRIEAASLLNTGHEQAARIACDLNSGSL